jgi:drug/metabolite transporter (DMT)-like permease
VSTWVVLVLAQLCFATLSVVGRVAMVDLGMPPDAIVITRMLGGMLVFFLWARARGERTPLTRADWRLLVPCALLGTVANQLLFLHGLEHLPRETAATSASLLAVTIPVFAAVFAVVLGRERLQLLRVLGIVLALAGALVLVDLDRLALSSDGLVGNLMILVNNACYALFLVLVRPLTQRLGALQLSGLLFAVGTVATAPLGAIAWIDLAPRITGTGVLLLAFIVAVPTVASYVLINLGLRCAESSAVATFIYLQPVFATGLAILILGEQPGPRVALAAALIFAGVWVSTRAPPGRAP